MKHKLLLIVGMICSLVFCVQLSAAILPNEIQDCVSNAVCSTPVLVQQESTFSAYSYLDGGTAKFLFEYFDLPSSESTNFSTTQLSGSVWISANETYDLTQERHFFNLYLDGVTPTPTNLWLGDSDGLDVGLSMPTADLLAGSSFFRMGLANETGDLFLEGDLGTHGDLGSIINGHSFVPCLADTCEVGAEFNLLNMQYLQSGSIAQLVLNPTDQRSLLYSQYRDWAGDDTWYRSQSYGIVPIPSALWLFGSGLLGLIGISRIKKAA